MDHLLSMEKEKTKKEGLKRKKFCLVLRDQKISQEENSSLKTRYCSFIKRNELLIKRVTIFIKCIVIKISSN